MRDADDGGFEDVPAKPKKVMPAWAWLLIAFAVLGLVCSGISIVSVFVYWGAARKAQPAVAPPPAAADSRK